MERALSRPVSIQVIRISACYFELFLVTRPAAPLSYLENTYPSSTLNAIVKCELCRMREPRRAWVFESQIFSLPRATKSQA